MPGSAIWSSRSSPHWTCDMRYLILSDIHGNIEALDAVLAAVDPAAYDATLVLGDLVGYGADPNAVIERVRSLSPRATIRGNHDKVAAGVEDAEGFNTIARSAVSWTMLELSPENTSYLAALQQGPQVGGRHDRDLPRDAVRRGCVRVRRARCPARARIGHPAGLPVRPHAHPRRVYPITAGARSGDARWRAAVAGGDQPRIGAT